MTHLSVKEPHLSLLMIFTLLKALWNSKEFPTPGFKVYFEASAIRASELIKSFISLLYMC